MDPNELVKFLNLLRGYVPGYWRTRIDEVITKIGGTVKQREGP